jgi:hypothetical protein
MRTFRACLAALLLALSVPLRAEPLSDPPPIQIPAGLAEIDVPRSILHSLAVLGWNTLDAGPGRITASGETGADSAKVLIVYDKQSVRLSYLDSTGLDYEENAGQRDISYRYNDLVKALAGQIARFDPGGRRTAQPNPPPAEKFSAFADFELKPLSIEELYAKGTNNIRAARHVELELRRRLEIRMVQWSTQAPPGPRRKLLIQPHIESIRFVAGGIRFLAHDMAGDSSIALRLTYTDADTGAVIASPRFFLEPDVEGRPGDSDNKMLIDIADLAARYTVDNYQAPVGGPAGDLPPPP